MHSHHEWGSHLQLVLLPVVELHRLSARALSRHAHGGCLDGPRLTEAREPGRLRVDAFLAGLARLRVLVEQLQGLALVVYIERCYSNAAYPWPSSGWW